MVTSSANNQPPSDRLPRGWISLRLDDIAPLATGGTPSTRVQSNFGDDFSFVSPGDIGNSKYVYTTTRRLSKTGFEQCRAFPEGSILFVSIGSTIGKCAVASELLTANQQINAVLPSETVATDFLYYALCERGAMIRAQAGEQAVPIVNKSQFGSTSISFPIDKREQILIGSALSDADALIDSLEQLLTKKRQIKQGAMQELLTGQRRLPGFGSATHAPGHDSPDGWIKVSIGEIAEVKTGPFGSALHERDYVPSGTPIITVEHLGERGVRGEGAPQVGDNDVTRLQAYRLEEGDIVFSRVGSIDRNARVSANEEGWLFSGRLLRLRSKTTEVDTQFLSYLFHGEPFRRQVERVAVGQTMASLNTKLLSGLEILMPAVNEQRAIANALSAMDAELDSLESRLTKARALKQAMAQALLTGRIRLVPEGAV